MKVSFALFLTFLTGFSLSAQTYTPESVPNVKLITNSYVSNPDNILAHETVRQIDSLLYGLEKNATAQVAVVVLNSIGEMDDFTFSQQLFNRWGIGQASNDNGLLILFAKEQRTVRFHTGNGIEGVLPDAVCKQIQREFMVPHFKEGNIDEGMLEGVRACVDALNNPEVFAENTGGQSNSIEKDLNVLDVAILGSFIWGFIAIITFIVKLVRKSFTKKTDVPGISYSAIGWLFMFLLLPIVLMIALGLSDDFKLLLGGLYSYFATTLLAKRAKIDNEANRWLQKKDYQNAYNFYKEQQGVFSVMRFLLPVPFAFLYGGYKRKLDLVRNHPRDCQQCGKPLAKLDETADDNFLSKGQLLEESLKSVDYDVWKCSSCNAAEKLSYINEDSKFGACPKCSTRAYHEISDRVIRAATTSSSGEGEQKHACKFCGHQTVRRYTIARIETSSSSSGSSSSSSGGSWGGGSSGGGGASSSW